MTTTIGSESRMQKIMEGLGDRRAHAPMLVRALGGCLDSQAACLTFELYRTGSGADQSDTTYAWKCDCLEEAMGVDELCGAYEFSAQERYHVLEDLLISGDWRE